MVIWIRLLIFLAITYNNEKFYAGSVLLQFHTIQNFLMSVVGIFCTFTHIFL